MDMESNKIPPIALRTRGKILERFYTQHPEKLLRRRKDDPKSSSEEDTTDDSDYSGTTSVTQSDAYDSDGLSSWSDDEDEVEDHHANGKRRKTEYEQGEKKKIIKGCSSATPILLGSENEDSGSSSSPQSSCSSDNDESRNRKYRRRSLHSKRGRKRQKLQRNSNPGGSVSKQSDSESNKSNSPVSVFSSTSSGEGDKEDNGAVPKKRGRKPQLNLHQPNTPFSVSKQNDSESNKSNSPVSVSEMAFSSTYSGEGDKEDNGAVPKKRGRKPKLNLHQPSTPFSVSTHKKRGWKPKLNLLKRSTPFSVSTHKKRGWIRKLNLHKRSTLFSFSTYKKRGRIPKLTLHKRSTPFSVSRHKKRKAEHHGVYARNGTNGKTKGQGLRNGREFINVLNQIIMSNGDESLFPPEETSSRVEGSVENTLPLKFRFEYEDPIPVEKTEYEKELEELFAGLEMGLVENEIGTSNVQMKEDEAVDVSMLTPEERCRLGHHVVIFDETVGKMCRFCGIVCEEIHDTLPDLVTLTGKKSDHWFAIRKQKGLFFGSLDFDVSANENHNTVENLTGPVMDLIPDDLREEMHVHQKEGYKFLWKNLGGAELIENVKTPLQQGGKGCIISHAPGTGKTFLTIVFLKTFLDVYPNCQPMIVAPQSMLLTWEAQFKKWGVNIPFHNLNDGVWSDREKEMVSRLNVDLRTLSAPEKRDALRMIRLLSWGKDRGVLGVGYQLFEKLAADPKDADPKFRKILLEKPGVVIFDEGHIARNEKSALYKVLTQIKTRRRIILSGTPFQNSMKELGTILRLVDPDFKDDDQRKPWGRGRPRAGRGQQSLWDSSTRYTEIGPADIKKVKSTLSPMVHVYEGAILEKKLPGLKDTLIVLKPTNEQHHLLEKIKALDLQSLYRFCVENLISIHPSVLVDNELFQDEKDRLKKIKHIHDAGVKTKVLVEIIRLSNARREKVLVFSLYLEPLKFISELLASFFDWTEGNEVLYMEGKDDMRDRQSMIDRFNNAEDVSKVLLASSSACSEGINLVGASRVVLLGVEWNPSKERQAISRAYRIGQTKVVHVYRLIMSGTSDMEKFRSQTWKDNISELIFSSKEVDNGCKNAEAKSKVSEDDVLDEIVQHPSLRDSFEHVLHQPKEAIDSVNFAEVFN